MPTLIEKPRNVCALGAFQTVLAIKDAVPVVHSGPGCIYKLGNATGMQNGGQFIGPLSPNMVPCSNISNSEVVFGGEEKLRNLIETSQKVIKGDLFVVLNGCAPALVGDDLNEVVGSFRNSEKSVVFADTTGFLGNNVFGHERILEAIIDQFIKPVKAVNQKLVNLFVTIPVYDPFWYGTINDVKSLVEQLGLEVNVIFGTGRDRGVESLRKIPEAGFNIVISPWWNLGVAESLRNKFGTPYFHYPVLPIGPTETGRFLRSLAAHAGIGADAVERIIADHEEEYYYYLDKTITEFIGIRRFPTHFVTAANSTYSLALTRFLVNDLGMIPDKQFVTDGVPEEHQARIREYFGELNNGIKAEVVFTEDGGEVHNMIRGIDFYNKPFILGSTWEKVLTAELNGYFLAVSTPVSDRVIMDRSYFGYKGGLRLIEDFYTVVQSDYQ
jgi:nitrogenase molybdenum-iron protein beta chain